jgi:HPt (histidine-containing phosphotransfer) domain-containing protein
MANITNNNMTANTDDEIINTEQFEDMRDLLEDDFVDLIQIYFNDAHHRIIKLRQAQQEEDNANGFELSHALKRASDNLAATQVSHLSSQLQELCRERLISNQAQLIEDIAVALQHAEEEINQQLGQ